MLNGKLSKCEENLIENAKNFVKKNKYNYLVFNKNDNSYEHKKHEFNMDIESILDVLGDYLTSVGFDFDYNPTKIGLDIESLITKIVRIKLESDSKS